MSKKSFFTEGQKVKYVGRGFIGFDPQKPEMEFIEYHGLTDVLVKYDDGSPLLVSVYDIQPISKKKK